MYCYKCGKENKDSSVFCKSCGTKLITNNNEKSKTINKIGENIASATVETGMKTAKKAMGTGAKIASFTAIFTLLLGLVNYYFTYMVETPADVVETFTSALDRRDVKVMVECLDPTFQKQYEAAFGIAGDMLNAITGTAIDYNALMDLSSAFSEYTSIDYEKCNATNFKVVKYEGEKLSAFVSQFGNKIPAIGNVLGSSATVEFEMDNKEYCYNKEASPVVNGNKIKYKVKVVKYGKDGWKIPSKPLE